MDSPFRGECCKAKQVRKSNLTSRCLRPGKQGVFLPHGVLHRTGRYHAGAKNEQDFSGNRGIPEPKPLGRYAKRLGLPSKCPRKPMKTRRFTLTGRPPPVSKDFCRTA